MLTYFSCKKHTAQEILKISGENNGRAKCSSRMAAIIAEALVRDNLDFKIHSTKVDSQGHYIYLESYIHDSPYFILNIYAPDKCSEQFLFFKDLSDILKGARVEQDHPFMVDGDFNIILDHVIDGQGGNSKRKDSGKIIKDISAELNLVDIWRIRNLTITSFTCGVIRNQSYDGA